MSVDFSGSSDGASASRPTGYLGQVEACRHLARARLQAARQCEDPEMQAILLKRDVEFGVRAVVTAWGSPVAKAEKLWTAFDESIRALLDPETADWVDGVRASSCSVAELLVEADARLETISRLADQPRPASFVPPPRSTVSWDDLAGPERAFLTDALAAARMHVPSARLWLFGSRATGEARADSDYDVLLVVPDATTREVSAQAMGFVWLVARQHQVEVDHQCVSTGTWLSPDGANETLVAEVRAYGIEVP
jgi:hypothetical protein